MLTTSVLSPMSSVVSLSVLGLGPAAPISMEVAAFSFLFFNAQNTLQNHLGEMHQVPNLK
jgi:hypothetical protein